MIDKNDKIYLLSISYDGSNFFGFVKQKNKITVQEVVEKILSRVFKRDIKIYYCSRTDKKVHALNQVIAVKLNPKINLSSRIYLLNKVLIKESIAINSAQEIKSLALSRYVISKTYCYKIYFSRWNLFLEKYYLHHHQKINIAKLKNILNYFKGKHNFFNFTKEKDFDIQTTTREITKIIVKSPKKNFLEIYFTGNGFLRYMIRKIIAATLDCYNQIITIDYLKKLISLEIIAPYQKLASGSGLYLVSIKFNKNLYL